MARISPIIVGVLLLFAAAPIGAGQHVLRPRSYRFRGGFYPLEAWRILRLERDVSRVVEQSGLAGALRERAFRALTDLTQSAWFAHRKSPARLTLTRAGRRNRGVRLVLQEPGKRHSLVVSQSELRISCRFSDSGFSKTTVFRGVGRDRRQGYLQLEVVERPAEDALRETAVLLDAEGRRIQYLTPTPLDGLDALARHFDHPEAWPVMLRGAANVATASPASSR